MKFYERSEVQVTFLFITCSIIWIWGSDRFFFNSAVSATQLTFIQSIKGTAYVVSVALIIYLLTRSANKRLIKSQKEYKDLFQKNPDPMWIKDTATSKFYMVNDAAIKDYGYSEEEFLKMTEKDLLYPEESDIKKSGDINYCRHKTKSGKKIYCHQTIKDIILENKEASLIAAHNISEIIEAKAEIDQRERHLQLILNSITDGFFIIDGSMNIIRANQNFKNLAETPVNKVEGRNIIELFPNIKSELSYKECSIAIQRKQSAHFETFSERQQSWYRVSAYPFDGGLSIFFRDITKEKEDELQIIQDEQNLKALINNTEDAIWSINKNFEYLTFNNAYEKGYNLQFNEELYVGKSLPNKKTSDEQRHEWIALYERALSGEKFSTSKDFFFGSSKRVFTVISFNPIYDQQKQVIGVGCFLRDLTERKEYEEKIERQNKKLKDIAYIISHTVRAPLANILGLCEVLDTHENISVNNLEVLDFIKTSADQLDTTIRDIVKEVVQKES